MTLPKVTVPTYELKLPSNGKTVKFRPFLVKEEKVLLMAAATNDAKQITNSVKDVVANCIINLDPSIKLDELPSFDFDYLFLNMRAKSIGDAIEQTFNCNNQVGDGVGLKHACGSVITVPLKVSDVVVTEGPKEFKIDLGNGLGLKMKYPKFKNYDMNKEDVETDILIDCLDFMYDNDNIFAFKDNTKEEIVEFIESLTKEKFNMIQNFYDNIPRLELRKKFKCGSCGFEHEMVVEDPISFF